MQPLLQIWIHNITVEQHISMHLQFFPTVFLLEEKGMNLVQIRLNHYGPDYHHSLMIYYASWRSLLCTQNKTPYTHLPKMNLQSKLLDMLCCKHIILIFLGTCSKCKIINMFGNERLRNDSQMSNSKMIQKCKIISHK